MSDEIFWRDEIVCHDREYAPMILAGGVIMILGLYTKYVSEIKLTESELVHCSDIEKKKGRSR